jgi:glycosyltransferase involved in cell wall biosynthesis
MKVIALVKGPHYPSSRYRVRQFERPLAARDVSLLVREFPRSRADWRDLEAALPGCAIVWIQKKRLPAGRLARLRRHGAKLVYDVDDAVMVASGDHPSWTRHWRFARMCEGVDAVTAGNDYLASLAALWNPAVRVVPTVLDASKYAVRPPPAADGGAPVVLGWIGGNKAMAYLEALRPVLAGLAKRGLPVRLKVVGGRPFEAPGVPVDNVAWSEEREAADVASFDVGLAPMPVTPWTLGKCGTKVLQCMAAGVPPAASRHHTHADIVTDGWNGVMAGTNDEWEDRLASLVRDPETRARMGRAARATVEARFSIEAVLPRLCEVFEQTAAGCRRPTPFA